MTELEQALQKHGSACDAVLNEPFSHWPIEESMQLIALMAQELAQQLKQLRHEAAHDSWS